MTDPSRARPFRVCITGAECTGKTTLARALGERLGAPVVFESVRDYFAEKARLGDATVFASDIVRVVDLQVRTEQRAPTDVPVAVYDTDVFTIAIWHERYLGRRMHELDDFVAERFETQDAMDLYVLANPDAPFVHDCVRGSGEDRERMHQEFLRALAAAGRHFIVVGGALEERVEAVLEELDRMVPSLLEETATG